MVNVASEVLENDGMTNEEKEELDEKLAKAEKEVASVEVEKQPVAEDNVTKEVAKTEESAPESLKEQTPTEEPSSPKEEVVTPTKKFVKKEIFSPFDDDVKPLTYKQLSATPSRASQLPVWPPIHHSSSSSESDEEDVEESRKEAEDLFLRRIKQPTVTQKFVPATTEVENGANGKCAKVTHPKRKLKLGIGYKDFAAA